MNLKEFLEQDQDSFFGLINGENIYPFMVDVEAMDFTLKLSYGSRTFAYEGVSKAEAAKFINMMLKETFLSYIEKEEVKNNLGKKINKDKQHTGTENNSVSVSEVDKVSSFDSDELLRDSGRDSDTTTNNSNTWGEVDSIDEVDNFKRYEILTRETKNTIIMNVIVDVAKTLTLKVY